jgi:hypothetical protein
MTENSSLRRGSGTTDEAISSFEISALPEFTLSEVEGIARNDRIVNYDTV